MYTRKNTGLKMDERGATFIPVRALLSIILAGIIVAIALIGVQHAIKIQAEKQVERECERLISSLSTIVASGDARDINNPLDVNGDSRTIELNFPNSLSYIGFGVDPDDNNNGLLETGLTANGSCIFYKIKGLSKRVIWLDNEFKFREGSFDGKRWLIKTPPQGYIIKGGGKFEITFELVEKNGAVYILIHAEDKYDA